MRKSKELGGRKEKGTNGRLFRKLAVQSVKIPQTPASLEQRGPTATFVQVEPLSKPSNKHRDQIVII